MQRKPISTTVKNIVSIWQEMLPFAKVGADDNFFELGGNSILAQKTVAILKDQYQIVLPIKSLYRFATANKIALFLNGDLVERLPKYTKKSLDEQHNHKDVAIIGLKVKFPGANSVEEFWNILTEGKETTTFFNKEELDVNLPNELINDSDYVAARGIIEKPVDFDADFFGISHKIAEIMDPQHRTFLELSRNLLETTGYLPKVYNGVVGIYAGCGNNTYYLNNVLSNPDKINAVGQLNANTVSDKDYISTRTAFQLNLDGPAVGVFSACSTSLLAIAEAVSSIRANQCDVAIAGGVSITFPVNSGHVYQEGAMLSKDGHCRSFDADATGTVFSDGAGAVLLKSLAEAEKDGDYIYAVIKGVGTSNDGGEKGSFTSPSAQGQANAIAKAIDDAQIQASDLSYIEAHGTATPIGDPIEIEGLSLAFGASNNKQYCAIGSVKSNFGHLTHAAGAAGLIKTALALNHKVIPPSIHYNRPNPNINFEETPFYVNHQLQTWDKANKLAGVSSFGVGGTNVHVILQDYQNKALTLGEQKPCLISWSAKSQKSGDEYGQLLAQHSNKTDFPIENIAYTLQKTRENFDYRYFTIAENTTQLALNINQNNAVFTQHLKEVNSEITFLFPGQGAQYAGMGKALYAQYPVFRQHLDECAHLISAQLNEDFLNILFSDTGTDLLNNTYYTQPALFAIEYALAKLWMSFGIKPAYFIGHSVGEFVAAHLAGIFSLADGIKLITTRANVVSEQPKGAMLSIKAPLQKIKEILTEGISIAAINTNESIVVAGETSKINEFTDKLSNIGVASKLLQTSHAFHSHMMDNAVEPFKAVFANIKLSIPKTPIVSTVTGNWLKDTEATDVNYWAAHLRNTVNFAAAVTKINHELNTTLIEVGPGSALAAFAKQLGAQKVVAGLQNLTNNPNEHVNFLNCLGKAWLAGVSIDFDALYKQKLSLDLSLANYAYDKKTYFIAPGAKAVSKATPLKEKEAPIESEAINATSTVEENQLNHIKKILQEASGVDLSSSDLNSNFIELGLDSLLLTQVAMNLKKEFNLPITFRMLSNELASLNLLNQYIQQNKTTPNQAQLSLVKDKTPSTADLSEKELEELKKPFGATPKIDRSKGQLTDIQMNFLRDFIIRYNKKTQKSKDFTQDNRKHMSDPRVVSGFKPLTKEMVYSLVIEKSKGCLLWDLDGNEYIDALNGFGSNLLGNQPDFLLDAIKKQMDKGYEIGPQSPLSATVARLMCDFTKFDRAALCNTGSEAVLGAMRIARTHTGRNLVVSFSGSYHGINDEVLIRGTKNLKTFPAASGIMPQAVQNMIVLDYGTEESLKIITEYANDIAAVLVEPVQSRRPEFRPIEYLKQLRKLTEEKEIVLIFDEVITGFRSHPGGAQALFNIKADIAAYGKVFGGGMPIGAICGKRHLMDALDGGFWQYGDDSMPEIGVTYFAGTFVRHPLALAAAEASLNHFKAEGPALQENLNKNTDYLVAALNNICKRKRIPVYIAHFSSLWKIKFEEEYPFYEIIFALMREKGIHIWDGFPCFLTTAHTQKDIDRIIDVFNESVDDLLAVNLIPVKKPQITDHILYQEAPVKNAQLGLDENGNPAWFIPSEENESEYLKIEYL